MNLPGRRREVTCRRAVELMTDYLDDALRAVDRRALERHLRDCPHCAQYLAQLRTTIATTGRITPDELTPEARSALVDLYRKTVRGD